MCQVLGDRVLTLAEALAWAATCTGESRTHEALRLLADHVKQSKPAEVFNPAPVVMTVTPEQAANVYAKPPAAPKLPPFGCCPVCLGKTVDGICSRCSL